MAVFLKVTHRAPKLELSHCIYISIQILIHFDRGWRGLFDLLFSGLALPKPARSGCEGAAASAGFGSIGYRVDDIARERYCAAHPGHRRRVPSAQTTGIIREFEERSEQNGTGCIAWLRRSGIFVMSGSACGCRDDPLN
jgi:hypothetical protein